MARCECLDDTIKKAANHDGIFVVIASLANQPIDAPQAVRSYKNLIRVEWAFRHLKSQIDMRPVFTQRDDHIKGHVLICFIAYYLRRALELTLEQMGEKLSADKALRELARVKAVKNTVGDITFYGTTRPSKTAQRLFSDLNILPPRRILISKELEAL